MNRILKNALILCLITLVAGVSLALTYTATRDSILNAEKQEEAEACCAVFPSADCFTLCEFPALPQEKTWRIEAIYLASANETNFGYVVRVMTTQGYGGKIVLVFGCDFDGVLTGLRVIDAANESPGLGARCMDSAFYKQFDGRSTPIIYHKQGSDGSANSIDAISGATITTDAITEAVNSAALWLAEQDFSTFSPAAPEKEVEETK